MIIKDDNDYNDNNDIKTHRNYWNSIWEYFERVNDQRKENKMKNNDVKPNEQIKNKK